MDSNPTPAWQREWGNSFRKVPELLDFLHLRASDAPEPLEENPRFPFRVPRAYAARMRPGDWSDPLLRQVLPFRSENDEKPGFTADAVGDGAAQDGPGLLRKYAG